MIGPKDLKNRDKEKYDLDELIHKIDENIETNHGNYFYEKGDINECLPLAIRNKISKKYLDAGWKFVYHLTSAEFDGEENFKQTMFILSMHPVLDANNYYKVCKREGISYLTQPIIVIRNEQDFSEEGFNE